MSSTMMTESSVERLTIPFPTEIVRVFKELERIEKEAEKPDALNRPCKETIEWAMEVLLRVVPSTFLIGSEIDAFESEIHVAWENDKNGKSVALFLKEPGKLKIYHERLVDGVVKEDLKSTSEVSDLSARLSWFFSSSL